jgi:hypothetical protein
VLLFFICLNLAGIAISTLVDYDILVGNKEVMPYDSSAVLAEFNLTTFATIGVGAGIAGLIGLITKQYVFAMGAALVWTLGCLFNVGQWLLDGFPKMVGVLLAGPELAPLALLVQTICTAMLTFYLFFCFAEILGQRSMVS